MFRAGDGAAGPRPGGRPAEAPDGGTETRADADRRCFL